MGDLPNDVRTALVRSDEKEKALLAKLLLLKTDSSRRIPTISKTSKLCWNLAWRECKHLISLKLFFSS